MEHIVLRLLEKDPARRFQNAGELVLALTALDPRLARSWPGTTAPGDPAQRPSEPVLHPGEPALHPGEPVLPPDSTTGSLTARDTRLWSATPIVVGAIAVIVAVGVGVAVVMRGDGAPANLVPAAAPAVPAAPVPSTSIAPVAPAPHETVAPAPPVPQATEAAAAPASATKRPGHKARDRGKGASAPPGKDLRPSEPPRPGEHTPAGSPMERDVGFERKRKPKDDAAP
jgi:hypothetical protein